ncbi:MAG: hypothetical protein AVDCRST_MAG56-1913 [uncultured Cytophagales bacterium]|uniref:HEPN domain-containing protein n=1 Tax=uncultured Cytophagales bacterium TaxID=158755 RepID=A0A6J4IH55_9SPHI|nr:MAG: hypothetical protein AVDCRST_MAG56-1913 [uncultured Cytophagales bacterium]
MQHFLRQAEENRRVLADLEANHPSTYFDWKTTVIFYTALHWMKAFLWAKYGEQQIESHEQIRDFYRRNKHIMPKDVYDSYHALYRYSQVSRYEGIGEHYPDWQALRKFDYQKAKIDVENFRRYMVKRGIITAATPNDAPPGGNENKT